MLRHRLTTNTMNKRNGIECILLNCNYGLYISLKSRTSAKLSKKHTFYQVKIFDFLTNLNLLQVGSHCLHVEMNFAK